MTDPAAQSKLQAAFDDLGKARACLMQKGAAGQLTLANIRAARDHAMNATTKLTNLEQMIMGVPMPKSGESAGEGQKPI